MIVEYISSGNNDTYNEKDDMKITLPSKQHLNYKFNCVNFNMKSFISNEKKEKSEDLVINAMKNEKKSKEVFLIRNKSSNIEKDIKFKKERRKPTENQNICNINGASLNKEKTIKKEEVRLIGDILNMKKEKLKVRDKEKDLKFEIDIVENGNNQIANENNNENYNFKEDKFEEDEENKETDNDNNLKSSLNDMIKYISTNKEGFKNTNRLLKDMYSLLKSENKQNNYINHVFVSTATYIILT
jgi:hypothetical protein